MYYIDYIYFLPEIIYTISILLLFSYALCFSNNVHLNFLNITKDYEKKLVWILFILLLTYLNSVYYNPITFIKILLIFFSIFCISTCTKYLINYNITTFEYFTLLSFIILGTLIFVSSSDLLTLYLSLELQSLSLYILVAYKKKSKYSVEASLKYFILGAFSSSLLLFGISLIYGFTGLINFNDLTLYFLTYTTNVSDIKIIIFGFLLIFVSMLMKISVAPFHMWSIDIYEGAPYSISYILTIIPKLSFYFILFIFLYEIFYFLYEIWQPILMFCSIFSIILGTLGTYTQKKIKRFLIYSSISHIGFISIGLLTGTLQGILYLFFYLFFYLIGLINIWLIIMNINTKNNKIIVYINDLNQLYKKNKTLSILLTINLLSLAGIPPLIGFFNKFFIFQIALIHGYYILLLIGIICSAISVFYYIRIIKIIYFENYNEIYIPLLKKKTIQTYKILINRSNNKNIFINFNKINAYCISLTSLIILFSPIFLNYLQLFILQYL